MAFFENCVERATALAATCGWLAFGGGLEAAVGVAIGGAGLAAVVSGAVRSHGPESATVLKAIRKRIAEDLGAYAEAERWSNSADLAAADEAMERALAGCFLGRQAFAASARGPAGFPVTATKLIIEQLAEREPKMFGASGPAIARNYANLVVRTALEAALENEGYFKNLHPHLVMETLRGIGSVEEKIDALGAEVRGEFKNLRELLVEVAAIHTAGRAPAERGISLSDLQALAERFGSTGETKEKGLTDFLVKKAEEYNSFVEQIEAIDARVAGLGNLKAAARHAAENLNFDEVENLLSRVHEVEIGIAAETGELRGYNAILRSRTQDAFRYFSATANAFDVIDQTEMAARQFRYASSLAEHGVRYGGEGVQLAVAMFGAALRVYTEAEHPVQWARTQNSLASALRIQGECTGGEKGNALLTDAVSAYRAAKGVYTEAEHPVVWAMIQNNLAIALRIQGDRTGGEKGNALLADAVSAYWAVLRVYTEAEHPVDWAMIQNNLASALRTQGGRTGGEKGNALLEDSVSACQAALRVRTEAEHPVQWAMTQHGLAKGLLALSANNSVDDQARHLRAALVHIDAALTVFKTDTLPFYHVHSINVRNDILERLSAQ